MKTLLGAVSTVVEQLSRDRDRLERLSGKLGEELDKKTSALRHVNSRLRAELTERKQAQDRAERQKEELTQAGRLIALGELVSGVAHEINNPNNVVLLNATSLSQLFDRMLPILDKHYEANADFCIGPRKYEEVRAELPCLVQEIREASERITSLVMELENFARRHPVEFSEEVNVNRVAESAVRLVGLQKAAKHRISANYSEVAPRVRGNFQQLEQVLVNVLQNAAHALPETGEDAGIHVETVYSPGAKSVLISIRDEGKGIPAEDLPKICDPFFTTRRNEGGTGLGLSVSSHIVREHGGHLGFESTPGEGTTVTVTLPIAGQEPAARDGSRRRPR